MKKIIMGVVLIMSLGLFGGCNSGIWFRLAYGKQEGFGYKNLDDSIGHSLKVIVSSQDELKALCEEWNNSAFDEENLTYTRKLNEQIRAYDDAYFSDKVLIICLLSGNQNISYSIKSIKKEEGIIYLNIKKKEPEQSIESVQPLLSWTFLLEVKKTDIANATNVQINFIIKAYK